MKTTKLIAIGGIMAVFSAFFQIIPVIFSELFTIATIFSTLPVYIVSRISPKTGVSTFAAASLLIFALSPHESLFFIFTNGIMGLCLGLCRYYSLTRIISVIVNSLALLITLNILITVFGINAFGTDIPLSFWVLSAAIFIFSLLYSLLYLLFAEFIYVRVKRFITI
jgi:hypothetical protein